MEERRKSPRLELESKLIIKRLDGQESEQLSIDIIDVSKTGGGFNCDTALTIGAVYEAFLTIWTKEVIHAFIEGIRLVPVCHNRLITQHTHRCVDNQAWIL